MFTPGDVVDITIKSAIISDRHDVTERVWFEVDEKPYYLPANSEFVAVVRIAPAEWPPQPGDLWRDNGDEVWFAVQLAPGDVAMLPSYPVSSSKRGVTPDRVMRTVGPLTLVHREGGDAK